MNIGAQVSLKDPPAYFEKIRSIWTSKFHNVKTLPGPCPFFLSFPIYKLFTGKYLYKDGQESYTFTFSFFPN